jgi:hypothetical protein
MWIRFALAESLEYNLPTLDGWLEAPIKVVCDLESERFEISTFMRGKQPHEKMEQQLWRIFAPMNN